MLAHFKYIRLAFNAPTLPELFRDEFQQRVIFDCVEGKIEITFRKRTELTESTQILFVDKSFQNVIDEFMKFQSKWFASVTLTLPMIHGRKFALPEIRDIVGYAKVYVPGRLGRLSTYIFGILYFITYGYFHLINSTFIGHIYILLRRAYI